MKNSVYSQDLYEVIQTSVNYSKTYFHTFCGVGHLFMSTLGFLSKHKNDERYSSTFTNLKTILNKYNVTGAKFEKSFLVYCPAGNAPQEGENFTINIDREFQIITENLKRDAIKNKKTAEIENLILELFTDKSYMLYTILSDITGSDMETDKLYEEIISEFKSVATIEITELEEIQEMTNLNKWVKEHPQTVIDADEPVKKIEMALSGRAIRCAILTGKAGTGKTTYIYELAQRINKGKVPEQFKNKIIYQLDPSALIAGTKYRGI